jgi:hypothetical protein
MGDVPRERGSLLSLLDAEPYAVSSSKYKPPTPDEIAQFRQALTFALRGQGEAAQPMLLRLGYRITDFIDDKYDPARPRRFYVIQDAGLVDDTRRYRGTYLLRRDADPSRGKIYLEAPYAIEQVGGTRLVMRKQALRTLLSADLGGLMLSTIDRCAETQQLSCIKCADSCVNCAFDIKRSYYSSADMGAADGTFFQAAHEVLSAETNTTVLSLSAHAETTYGYLVGDGTRETATAMSLVHRFRDHLKTVTGLTVKSCNNSDGVIRLCGGYIVQGRQLNGYTPLCSGTMAKPERRFLFLNQLRDLAEYDASVPNGDKTALAEALILTFP